MANDISCRARSDIAKLLTSSYVLHVTNQTAIIDPTIAGVTGAIQNSASLTNTSLPQ